MRLLFLGKAKKCDYLISAVVKPGIIMMTFWPFINIITVQLLHSTVPLYVCYLNHPRISIWNGRKIFQGGSNSKITLELHLCWECNECECLESHWRLDYSSADLWRTQSLVMCTKWKIYTEVPCIKCYSTCCRCVYETEKNLNWTSAVALFPADTLGWYQDPCFKEWKFGTGKS